MQVKRQYFLYLLFAVLATAINLGTQRLMKWIIDLFFNDPIFNRFFYNKITYGLLIQMAIATIIAFIFKYLADKWVIFKDKTAYFSHAHLKQVLLYGLFAVFTTLLFWLTELAFKTAFNFANAEYLGGLVGLALGYTFKFLLDRKFVFNQVSKNYK